MTENSITLSERSRFRAALILAIAADALQLVVFPLFVQGALSPADDILDLAVAAGLVRLLGWHWEFLPAFAAEFVPGVDLVPCWSIAVANVYRKKTDYCDRRTTERRAPGAGRSVQMTVAT